MAQISLVHLATLWNTERYECSFVSSDRQGVLNIITLHTDLSRKKKLSKEWIQQITNVAQVCMATLLSPAYSISDLQTFITVVCWEILISSKQLKIMPDSAN